MNESINDNKIGRVLARANAKELSADEIKQVSGGGCEATAEVTFGPDGGDAQADINCTF